MTVCIKMKNNKYKRKFKELNKKKWKDYSNIFYHKKINIF